jgi:uncharacterized protein YgiM (DUF1202 family)
MIFENSPIWSSEQQGFELISFNLKGKQLTSTEATKLPPQKAKTLSESLPPLAEKPQTVMPATPPPVAPQTAINKVEAPLKTPASQPEKPQTIIPTNLPSITPQTAVNKVAVTGIYANIRSGAGNEFPIIATVKQGDKLILLGEYGEWYIVRLENGQEGWINNRFTK